MALIPPFFLDCVVAIGFVGQAGGQPTYQATGFLYGAFVKDEGGGQKTYRIFLVTNRHVFEGASQAVLRFNPEGGSPAREFPINLVDGGGEKTWSAHEDPSIDVAVIGINGQKLQVEGIRFGFFQNDSHIAPTAKAAEVGVSEGDGVFLLGFPMGLVGETRNVVVVRQGAIARIRDCLDSKSPDFLIDCSVFPGNSGGPVVTRPEVTCIEGTKAVNRAYLLGIVAAYLPYQDVAISSQTRRPRVIFEENSGLASVFPVDHVENVVGALMAKTTEPPATKVGKTDAA